MTQYRLLKNSTRGPAGSWVDVDAETARQLAVNGIIDLANPAGPQQRGPEVLKKRPGRPRKATSASNAAE
jgi:hypothetical protein